MPGGRARGTAAGARGQERTYNRRAVKVRAVTIGAPVSAGEWWWLNQIPVTLGNIAGGVIFTALTLYLMHGKRRKETVATPAANTRAEIAESAPVLQ